MTTISVYDIEAKKIEQLADEHDTTIPEIIEAFLNIVESDEINLSDWI